MIRRSLSSASDEGQPGQMPYKPYEMILIAEIVHPGERHLRLNSALVSLVHRAFPDKQITMICEQEHARSIKTHGDSHCRNTIFRPFRSYNPGGILFWPCKIAGEWRNILRVIRYARKRKPVLLIWTALFPTGQWALRLLSPLLLHRQQQYVLLQGELEYLNPDMQKPTDRILRFLLRRTLKRAPDHLRFMVLADYIKEQIGSLGLCAPDKIYVLPHPFHYTLQERTDETAPGSWIAGTFGALQERKNSHYIFRLAEAFSSEIQAGRIAFHAAGKCTTTICHMSRASTVRLHGPDRFLSQAALEAVITRFDLALFFYDNAAYTWCASGAVHEALQLEIPVLALRNHYFDWLVHTHGAICILFDELPQMECFIRELIRGQHTGMLEQIRENMRRFKLENNMEKQVQRLIDILRH